MSQQGQNGTSDNKDLGVVPALPQLVELGEKCATIKKLSTEVLQKAEKEAGKKSGSTNTNGTSADVSIQPIKQQLTRSFVQLRSLNRKANLEKAADKLCTQEAKTSMDRIHLQLQDLNYMKSFLEREIRRCKSFRSKYQKITLIPEQEFFARAPERLTTSLPKGEASDKQQLHHLMLQRLNFEKEERMRLKEEVQCKLKRKKEISERIAVKKSKIDNSNREIEKFIKESKPLEELFTKTDEPIPMETE
ncbi:14019_t:CDS:2 [Acaulospora morrowiae]|uniref:14019_t:CDS:1 n=1 Tax=Acaulospora morrowiae TaxID=94023 RepID=A0A9N8Z5K1_9GLOM|nr:14019_t:CDS:2 [Acaulospora morrowiae]